MDINIIRISLEKKITLPLNIRLDVQNHFNYELNTIYFRDLRILIKWE